LGAQRSAIQPVRDAPPRPVSTGADTSQADSQHDPCPAPTSSERADTSAWSTSRSSAATATRLPALGHAPADLRARHFIAAQIPATAAWDRVAGSAVTRVVSGCPLPPMMAMFAHGTQTPVPVIRPVTTISHPNPSRGGCRDRLPGRASWLQVRDVPATGQPGGAACFLSCRRSLHK
jgi:hypothetical protein